ncbi:RNA-directed DNA methylation 4 isoform X2 [Nicotiana tabacum]|uniref:RNA-directed DNA methylation 4 isoform X2 n=2 Tax=Nicotiana TaxID=4085 RepID=A0A1S4BA65_TOBAC|nr:PREDICTED: RNA-directed DNA methylation 4 isoform X2 [Nicotiana sylvestris]XP_016485801.1 PREDICTED: RNA-directed DNA methylation 4-like isoform X2 [Nicotiana tabacum]
MAAVAESSSVPSKEDKPVIVRVKRKAFQSRVDAFWLEINERPLKRPLLDFEKLSISDSSSRVEELKSRKVLVRHVETVTSSKVTVDILKSFASAPVDSSEVKEKAEIRRSFRAENKQDQLLAKAKQKQEDLSKNARFEQIWKSRKEKEKLMHDEELNEMCRLYDVIRVDTEEKKHEVQEETTDLEDHRMMSQYLPLLREVMPSAAEEIESEIHNYKAKQGSSDGYVYDYYAVKDDTNTDEDIASPFPLVQVDDDDDYYDGPDYSDDDSDDSNAEHNPWNDYPDEEESEDEDEDETQSSGDKSEVLSSTSQDQYGSETVGVISFQNEDVGREDWSDYADPLVDGESDGEDYNDDDEDIW